jgi:uncharacterized protein with von Willebrand factor type A (vWA) domain
MSSPATAFDATALDQSYSFLDALPEQLYVAVVAATGGTLSERVAGVLSWRESLLAGQLPAESSNWPDKPLRDMLRKELADLQLPRFCRNQPALADELLLDVLKTANDFSRFIPQRQRELFEELKRLEEERRKKPQEQKEPNLETLVADTFDGAKTENLTERPKPLPADVIRKLQNEAARRAEDEGIAKGVALMRGNWTERSRVWSEIWDVFGDLGELLGRGRDLARSVLRHHGWQEVARLRKLLENCKQLTELIRTLGRLQEQTDENAPSVMERIFIPVRRALNEWREVQTEFAPHEVHGLTLSDDVSRMIPAEAVTLGHPLLKYVWHARRIEHALLTYRVQGVMAERVSSESDVMTEVERPKPKPKLERGPIIVCLDTSGSMHGAPEIVAKAVVLEALRVAHAEKRACFLYSFSGPSSVAELELKLTDEGLAGLLEFLACSFHGGTDVAEPLQRAIKRLQESAWQRADVVLVSDGEFPVPTETSALIRTAGKDLGMRLHGILVGSGYSGAMEALCNPVHRFADWKFGF